MSGQRGGSKPRQVNVREAKGSDSKVGSQEYHMQHSNENENKGKTSDEEISGE